MKRPDRIHGYLVENGVRIAIRSATVAGRLEFLEQRVELLKKLVLEENAERAKLNAEIGALRATRWVKFGTWLRIVRS